MARRSRGTKKIDFTHWTGFQGSFFGQSAGSAGKTLVAAGHESETLLRTRGNLTAYIDGVQAPASAVQIAVGFHVVPEGTGTTVLNSPATNPDSQWFWYDIFLLGYEEYVTDVVDALGLSVYRTAIDSKVMRIIRNEEIQVVFQSVTILGAADVNVHFAGRFLTGK